MSAIGTTFAMYKLEKVGKHVNPVEIPSADGDMIPYLVPQPWWNHKLLNPARVAKLLKIIEDVKEMSLNF